MNEITATVNTLLPIAQPLLSTAVGVVIATLFIRKNTKKVEIEKWKQARFANIADALLEGGHITHLEYYKCNNFLQIAKKADLVLRAKFADATSQDCENAEECNKGTQQEEINIDWFIRFFEGAGNISDEQMQELWARLLAGELVRPSSFSLRTLEILRNMSKEEAEYLRKLSTFTIATPIAVMVHRDTYLLEKHRLTMKERIVPFPL